MNRFKSFALAAVAAATLSLAMAPPAEARSRNAAIGIGIGALIIGGAGAVISSRAYAQPHYAGPVRNCHLMRQWVDTPYGPERRTIRLCN
jgi:hypothetical protein